MLTDSSPLLFAVIGHPIDHSLSPMIHNLLARQCGKQIVYEKIDVAAKGLERKITHFFKEGGMGLNITAPYKQHAFTLCDKTRKDCLPGKVVNTLWRQDNSLWGDNTDGVGLIRDLNRTICLRGKKILILGAGGAVRAILPAIMRENPSQISVTNRTLIKAYSLADSFQTVSIIPCEELQDNYEIIIHATSSHFDSRNLRLPNKLLKSAPFCYDLAYNTHGLTPFTIWARDHGCDVKDGLGMLVEQAAEAFYQWHRVKPDARAVIMALRGKYD